MKKVLLITLFGLLLASCGANSAQTSNKESTVPAYEGMTVSRSSRPLKKLKLSEGEKIDDNHKEHDEEIEKDITDIVTIDVQTDEEVKYYVNPNEMFIIEVHLSNPSDFEIQSFTLNGKKYANYMFKEGSTMELLLLETTAPSTSGYINYTIDAIKYIEGTEIKDVDMSKGNKSIIAGVSYTLPPKATITNYSINTTYVEMSIDIDDSFNLIGNNELSIHLSDGQKAIQSKNLKVGHNSIKFDNLEMSKEYQYGIVAVYDYVDGRDLHPEWILKNTFKTLGAFQIKKVAVSKTSVSFDVERKGEVGIIDSISLFDANDNSLVEKGSSSTRVFENLLSNHSYNLYVDFSYTVNGAKISDWVAEKDITTVAKMAPTLTFDSSSSDKTSISYNVSTKDIDGILNITKVELLKNGAVVKDNGTSLSGTFSGLLSNNDYAVRVSYTYDLNDGQGLMTNSITKDIVTVAKATPTVVIADDETTGTTIKAQVSLNDEDSLGYIDSVQLFKNDELVSTNSSKEISFNNLDYYTDYKVVVTFSYDLNDGIGIRTSNFSKNYKTSPYLAFNSCKIINTSAVSEGETIYMQVSLNNPQGALPTSVVVNGQSYNCSSSTTPNKLFVEIVNEGQFEGGDTNLVIEKVNMILDGNSYSIIPSVNNSDNVFINGIVSVLEIKFVDENFEPLEWGYSSKMVYVLVTLSNKTEYTIYSVSFSYNSHSRVTRSDDSIHIIDSNHFYFAWSGRSGWNNIYFTELSYRNSTIDKTITLQDLSCSYFKSFDDTVHYVSKIDDLLDMDDGYYYELSNDIDLTGIEWNMTNDFYGIFDAKNHSIKNMSLVKTFTDSNAYFGLFTDVDGIVENLSIKSMTCIVSVTGEAYVCVGAVGAWAADTTDEEARAIIRNCVVDDDSNIIINASANQRLYVGGLVGVMPNGGEFNNNVNNAFIKINMDGLLSGRIDYHIGGICGHSNRCDYFNNTNNGDIEAICGEIGGMCGSVEVKYSFLSRDMYYLAYNTNNGNITARASVKTHVGAMYGNIKGDYVLTDNINNGTITLKQ